MCSVTQMTSILSGYYSITMNSRKHLNPKEIGKELFLSGYLLHSHGIDGPFIDGLPINSMVIFHGYVK